MKGSWIFGAALFILLAPTASAQDAAKKDEGGKNVYETALEDEIRSRILRDDWRVTMNWRDAKVQDIIEDFRRQVRISIVLDMTNIPEEFRVDEFILKDVPFREAFSAFLSKATLMIDEESANLIRISRPPLVRLSFKDADIREVLDVLARISNANIVVSPEVKGQISLNMVDVPWMDVLEACVKTLNFTTVREKHGIIRVTHPDELTKQMETRVFPLRYIQPPPVFKANIQEGKFVFGKFPKPPQAEQDRLDGFFLKPTLEAVLTRSAQGVPLGRLDYDPQTNAFVVTDVKPVLDRIENILKLLDQEPAQVIVELKFLSTTNEDLLNFGTNFFFGLTGEDGFTSRTTPLPKMRIESGNGGVGNVEVAPYAGGSVLGKVTQLPFGVGDEFGRYNADQYFLTEYDMTATFRAFKRDRYTRLIQEPTIAAVDNEMATIFVGEEIRFAESEARTNSLGGLEVTFGEARQSPVSVGFQLFVMPRIIKESNRVLLTLIPSNEVLSGTTSPLVGFERFTIAGLGVGGADASIDLPRIAKTTIVSKMLLESGKTAVLGGLVVERSTMEDKKLPLLGDIPIIGYLFKQTNDTIRKEHLLIFVTPRIVRMDADNERIQADIKERQDDLRRKFEEMRGEDKKDSETEKESGK